MQSFLINYLPSIIALAGSAAVAFVPGADKYITTHPAASTFVASAYAMLMHMIPGSPLGGGTLSVGVTPPPTK